MTDPHDAPSAPSPRTAERLRAEAIAWLTTVSPEGVPQSSPIWYVWTADPGGGRDAGLGEIVMLSRPGAPRLRNLAANPQVAVNLNSDAEGGDVATFEGVARVDRAGLSADEMARYRPKYEAAVPELGMTWGEFLATYSVPVRVRLVRVRQF